MYNMINLVPILVALNLYFILKNDHIGMLVVSGFLCGITLGEIITCFL